LFRFDIWAWSSFSHSSFVIRHFHPVSPIFAVSKKMILENKTAMETFLPVRDYDLAATLDSGQVFRWRQNGNSWEGIIGTHFVRLTQTHDGIRAETVAPVAVAACRGLRLLRQEPWECLASFILSSTKQIVQIRQIIALLCERFGEPLAPLVRNAGLRPGELVNETIAPGRRPALQNRSFPSPHRLAALTETELRACKMGFRAPHLLNAARQIAAGKLDLEKIRGLPLAEARSELMKLRGVGGKIADCILLFAYGFDSAFPVDVWVERALRQLYFPQRRVSEKKLRHFAVTHFGPRAGYAQQYLFHYIRTKI
jgi:N-glycosylase/DNA lyase